MRFPITIRQFRASCTTKYRDDAARRISMSPHSWESNAPLDVHPEVEEALARNRPVVALETTLVTHGFPYPANLELAQSLEDIVRSTGSIPATIGIIDGRIKVGLTNLELGRLADTKSNTSVVKISRRDIPPAIALKADGGTTCSATLIFAALAGIKVFATGGLGGVHRGGENSMDISADLFELTRCPVGLVSAGVKSILDIGRTLEYLETLGVPVVSYGSTKDFPAFFSPRSGFTTSWYTNDPQKAADMLLTQRQFGMSNGILFAVPIPAEFEAVGAVIQNAVEQAVAESEANGISKRGKEATPWLLSRVAELTKGESLTSNVALLKNTAFVGGQIAVQYAKLAEENGSPSDVFRPLTTSLSPLQRVSQLEASDDLSVLSPKVVVMGSAALDICAQAQSLPCSNKLGVHSTAPGRVSLSLGGVGRNIAEACHYAMRAQSPGLASATLLISTVGNDAFGNLLVDETRRLGMRTDGITKNPGKTAVCNMIIDSAGSLIGGVADMKIIESLDSNRVLKNLRAVKPAIVALDGNLNPDTINSVVENCNTTNTEVFFEPTSVIKSTAIFPAVQNALKVGAKRSPVTYVSPNLLELTQMYNAANGGPFDLTSHEVWWSVVDNFSLGSEFRMHLEQLASRPISNRDATKGTLAFIVDSGVVHMAVNLLPFFQNFVIKCGGNGVIVVMRICGGDIEASGWVNEQTNINGRYVVAHGKSSQEMVVVQHFPPLAIKEEEIVNVTGAGDSLVGTILAALVEQPRAFHEPTKLKDIIDIAQRAAIQSLKSDHSVSAS